jgi:hypothetical protein
MKKTILISALFLVLSSFTIPGSDCGAFIFFKEGTSTTMTNYDQKDKITSSVKTVFTNVVANASGASVSAHQEVFDKKGKPSSTSEFVIKCENGILYFDMKTMLPQQQAEAYKDFEVTVEGVDKEIPSNFIIGSTLKDASVKFKFKTKSGTEMPMMNMTVNVTNRKVEAKEKITTAAGTFDCYKITEDISLKTIVSLKMKSITWFNLENGTIKSESYKENGKLTGKSELTEITKK